MHNEGEVDPVRDIEIINNELFAKDRAHITKVLEEVEKIIKRQSAKSHKEEREVLIKC